MAFLAPLNPPITQWQGLQVWLVGASTGIGAALAQSLQQAGAQVALSARNQSALDALVTDSKSIAVAMDVTDPASVKQAFEKVNQQFAKIDLIVWLAGGYTPMRADDYNASKALQIANVNYMGLLNGLEYILPLLIKQKSGTLALVSSVAGYGGLPKSLAYGPTKAAMINLAETLYMDLNPKGIGVVLISPGFVETPLTAQNDFKMPALITPAQAAQAIINGLQNGNFEIAFPKRFTNWLRVLRLVPYRLYFKIVGRTTGL
jgi:NADP-dependent 3-hydroxy acid dehydrogenase YdfG